MAVYVDALRYWGWVHGASCHMIADTNEELHAMAHKIGLKREWFQTSSVPHYDLTRVKRKLAVSNGAKEIGNRELAFHIIRWRKKASSWVRKCIDEESKDRIRAYLYR